MTILNRILFLYLWAIFCIAQFSCRNKIDEYNAQTTSIIYPSYIPKPAYDFATNKLSKEKINLGRYLFYDPILSLDSTISCASCHKIKNAFADAGLALSEGINKRLGTRNSPALINIIWNSNFMWDGGINHIEIMPFAPITNHVEMDEEMNHLLKKLNNNNAYLLLFHEAFGIDKIEAKHLFYVLAQFMGQINSFDSKYDNYKKGYIKFNESEKKGYDIFKIKCNQCHTEPMFTSYGYENNGLDSSFGVDEGRYKITLNPSDLGKFKIPTLRNIAYTYPYMHDGRFENLDEVLLHYKQGIVNSATLNPSLAGGLQLSAAEISDLKSFLNTLSDSIFINSKELENPF